MEKIKIGEIDDVFENGEFYAVNIEVARKHGSDMAILLSVINDIYIRQKFVLARDIYAEFQQFSIENINRRIGKLQKEGYLKRGIPDIEKKVILTSKNCKGMGIGNCVCSWCGCKTMITHEHHFPIRKSNGGTETVAICPTCHSEFHIMDNAIIPI